MLLFKCLANNKHRIIKGNAIKEVPKNFETNILQGINNNMPIKLTGITDFVQSLNIAPYKKMGRRAMKQS